MQNHSFGVLCCIELRRSEKKAAAESTEIWILLNITDTEVMIFGIDDKKILQRILLKLNLTITANNRILHKENLVK